MFNCNSCFQNILCIQQLRNLLKQLTDKYASYSTRVMIKNALENDTGVLGLLINERFINIPAQISIPLFENLLSEMRRAVNKKMSFNFSYYILISKQYKINVVSQDQTIINNTNQRDTKEQNIIWSNPEEEIFAEEAICSFEFSVEQESDSALSGRWTEDDYEMVPYRRVLLIEASKMQQILDKIKTHLT
jgi:protein BCP1